DVVGDLQLVRAREAARRPVMHRLEIPRVVRVEDGDAAREHVPDVDVLAVDHHLHRVGAPALITVGNVADALAYALRRDVGLALLRLLAPYPARPLPLGDSSALGEGDLAMAVSAASGEGPALVQVLSRRAFTAGWEYALDSAIFTYPPVSEWSGAPLISSKG